MWRGRGEFRESNRSGKEPGGAGAAPALESPNQLGWGWSNLGCKEMRIKIPPNTSVVSDSTKEHKTVSSKGSPTLGTPSCPWRSRGSPELCCDHWNSLPGPGLSSQPGERWGSQAEQEKQREFLRKAEGNHPELTTG